MEDAYGYSKFARAVLGTNSIDFRSRPFGAGEADFLATHVAGRSLGEGVTYADLETAGHVVLVGFEPEDESPLIFLRLRKAVRKKGLTVTVISAYASAGTTKLDATLVATVPGEEVAALRGLELAAGNVVLVGERAALVPGLLTAVAEVAEAAGARFAWVPRRAGDRGAIEAGCLPGLLPGGRPVTDGAARVDVAAAWEVESLPGEPGLDATAMLAAAASGELKALVAAGLEPADFTDAAGVRAALESAGFVVALESRTSEVTERADVVFPVALIEEHAGTFLNWEHRAGRVNTVIKQAGAPMTDLRVLAALADGLGRSLGVRTLAQARAELTELGTWDGGPVVDGKPLVERVETPKKRTARKAAAKPPKVVDGEATVKLATWRQLIDGGRGQDGEEAMAATARPSVARVSPALAEALGVVEGDSVSVSGAAGWYTLPVAVTPGMAEGAVWVPTNSPGTPLGELGLVFGDEVTLSVGGEA
jgi:NADH-quinone oxidoreductase subunit G